MSKGCWVVAALGLAVGGLAWVGPGFLPTGPAGGPSPTPSASAGSVPTTTAEPVVTVHLTTGRAITGKLAAEDAAQVVLLVPQGKLTFPRKLVERIEREATGRFALSEALEHALAGRHDEAEAAFREALADPGSAGQARAAYARYQAKLEHSLAEDAAADESAAQPAAAPEPRAGSPTRFPDGWPPGRVDWEAQDPDRAFARARREGKAVLLYLGNAGCPHCRAMDDAVWSRPEVAEASRGVVPLALYRGGHLGDWQLRLGLRAYPRVVWLDGWGRRLSLSAEPRSAAGMLGAIEQAARLAAAAQPAPRAQPPAGLLRRLPAAARQAATDPYALTRSRAWRDALPGLPVSCWEELYAWAQGDDAPLVRRAILLSLATDAPAAARRRLLQAGLEDGHTWVHAAALEVGGRLQERSLLAPIQAQVRATCEGAGSGPDAFNELSDLLGFLAQVPDGDSLAACERVLARYGWRYGAMAAAIRATSRIHASDPGRLRAAACRALRAALERDEVRQQPYADWQARRYRLLVEHAWQVLGRPAPAGSLPEQLKQTRAALR